MKIGRHLGHHQMARALNVMAAQNLAKYRSQRNMNRTPMIHIMAMILPVSTAIQILAQRKLKIHVAIAMPQKVINSSKVQKHPNKLK